MSVHIEIRSAIPDDAALLAQMNQRLNEDEKSRNPMTLVQLEKRMCGYLTTGWSAALVSIADQPAGYMLYQQRPDDYFPERKALHIYIRQFFIQAEQRQQGVGRAAFNTIRAMYFPNAARITLDVLEANPGGRLFWEQMGFKPYSTLMEMLA